LISPLPSANSPTLSLLTPVYNAEVYLPALIDAVAALSALHPGQIEWVVVNDGSTDASLSILQAAAHRLTAIQLINQPNGGVAAARNAALDAAGGDYLWYVDADDLIDANAVSALLTEVRSAMSSQAQALDLVCFAALREAPGQQTQVLGLPTTLRHASISTPVQGEVFTEALVAGKCWRHFLWTYWYRRDYLRSLELRFHPGLIHEDIAFITEAAVRATRAAAVDATLYHYRVNAASLTQSLSVKQLLPRIDSYYTVIAQLREINHNYVRTPTLRRLLSGEVIGQSLQVFELAKQLPESSARSQVLLDCRRRSLVQSLWPEALASQSWKRFRQFAKMWLMQAGWLPVSGSTITTQERP
jgi:glycosyltransferase involved in cell wall biosynthesis